MYKKILFSKLLVYIGAIFCLKLLLYVDSLILWSSNLFREKFRFKLSPYIPTSYWYKEFVGSAYWEKALFSVRIICLKAFVVFLNPSKKIPGNYIVIEHNNFHIYSNSFSCYSRPYFSLLSSILTTLTNNKRISMASKNCVYTLWRFSWWQKVDIFEICRVHCKINLRISTSRFVSLYEYLCTKLLNVA